MKYGDIIKRSWTITWRYKALWLLGIFAGVSGCQGSGSSTGNSNYNTSGGPSGDLPMMDGFNDFERFIPVLVASVIGLLLVGLVWAIIGVAARGGLIHAVNRIEESQHVTLGEAWRVGFANFWRVLGLGLLLQFPVFLLVIGMAVAIIAPVMTTVSAGGEPGPEMIAPICGALGLGLPLLLVAQLLLGLLYLVALRYIVIGGRGVFDAVRSAWAAMMARKKDHLLMWLINWGLNMAASFVLAIPIVIVTIAAVIPAFVTAENGDWGAFAAAIAAAIAVAIVLSMLYTGIWGVYTSAFWTLFFRKLTGLDPEPVVAPAYPPAYAAPGAPQYPAPPVAGQPAPPAPPAADYPSAPPAPPVAEQPPAPPAPPVADYPSAPPAPPVAEQPAPPAPPAGPDA